MHKPLILFDIDQTMFDTPRVIRKHVVSLARLAGTSVEKAQEVLSKYRNSLNSQVEFTPQNYFQHAAAQLNLSADAVAQNFYNSDDNFQSALYPEVRETLSVLQKEAYPLGVYSEGNLAFQETKLKSTGIFDFFLPEHRHILPYKREPKLLESLPENTIIIDDKPVIVEFLTQYPHLIPLHLVRTDRDAHENGANAAHTPVGVYTLTTLHDLWPILETLKR